MARWTVVKIDGKYWILLNGEKFGPDGFKQRKDAEKQADWNAICDAKFGYR